MGAHQLGVDLSLSQNPHLWIAVRPHHVNKPAESLRLGKGETEMLQCKAHDHILNSFWFAAKPLQEEINDNFASHSWLRLALIIERSL